MFLCTKYVAMGWSISPWPIRQTKIRLFQTGFTLKKWTNHHIKTERLILSCFIDIFLKGCRFMWKSLYYLSVGLGPLVLTAGSFGGGRKAWRFGEPWLANPPHTILYLHNLNTLSFYRIFIRTLAWWIPLQLILPSVWQSKHKFVPLNWCFLSHESLQIIKSAKNNILPNLIRHSSNILIIIYC